MPSGQHAVQWYEVALALPRDVQDMWPAPYNLAILEVRQIHAHDFEPCMMGRLSLACAERQQEISDGLPVHLELKEVALRHTGWPIWELTLQLAAHPAHAASVTHI